MNKPDDEPYPEVVPPDKDEEEARFGVETFLQMLPTKATEQNILERQIHNWSNREQIKDLRASRDNLNSRLVTSEKKVLTLSVESERLKASQTTSISKNIIEIVFGLIATICLALSAYQDNAVYKWSYLAVGLVAASTVAITKLVIPVVWYFRNSKPKP